MESQRITRSAQETRAFGEQVAADLRPGTVLGLSGELGSGKTTFTQGFLESLGAPKPYISPTFVIMKQYDLPEAKRGIKRVYHADAYRVEEKDFKEIGFSEWCSDPEGIVLLEWPERVEGLLPKKILRFDFLWKSDTEREIRIKK